MSQLTLRPDNDPHRPGEWFVYFGDVRIGHIGKRTGISAHAPQWGWSCGFCPGCDPGKQANGTAETFEEARAGFEPAWSKLAATRTEAHYEAWRRNRDWHSWKDRMHSERLPLPTQPDGYATCFCGMAITGGSMSRHVQTVHRGIGE